MISGLNLRILTAAVLAPLMIGAVFVLPTPYLALAFGGVILIAAWEWSGIIGWTSSASRWAYTLTFVPVLGIAYGTTSVTIAWFAVLALALAWWLAAALWVLRFQQGRGMSAWRMSPVRILVGLIVLVPAWVALIVLHAQTNGGPRYVVFLMLLIWAADTGAFLIGRRWGSRQLASRVSPGKSWEGAGGGLLAGAVLAVLFAGLLGMRGDERIAFMLLCMLVVPVSILGDLVESLFKRQAGVKDSGSMLPGHGGVLDRIDSMTSAAPFFVLALEWLRTVS